MRLVEADSYRLCTLDLLPSVSPFLYLIGLLPSFSGNFRSFIGPPPLPFNSKPETLPLHFFQHFPSSLSAHGSFPPTLFDRCEAIFLFPPAHLRNYPPPSFKKYNTHACFLPFYPPACGVWDDFEDHRLFYFMRSTSFELKGKIFDNPVSLPIG